MSFNIVNTFEYGNKNLFIIMIKVLVNNIIVFSLYNLYVLIIFGLRLKYSRISGGKAIKTIKGIYFGQKPLFKPLPL